MNLHLLRIALNANPAARPSGHYWKDPADKAWSTVARKPHARTDRAPRSEREAQRLLLLAR